MYFVCTTDLPVFLQRYNLIKCYIYCQVNLLPLKQAPHSINWYQVVANRVELFEVNVLCVTPGKKYHLPEIA